MNVQLELFQDEKRAKEQRKFLNMLIELKSKEIEEKEFHNFFGTPEQISSKKLEVNKKIDRFTQQLKKAFPDAFKD